MQKRGAKTINSTAIKPENVKERGQKDSDFLIYKVQKEKFESGVYFCCLVN
jgi:hypothetical protein